MADFETRPYLTASPQAVELQVTPLEPDVELMTLPKNWRTGETLRLAVSGRLKPRFWVDTAIDPSEQVHLVSRMTCNSTRRQWIEQVPFEKVADSWIADAEITPDSYDVSTELEFEIFVSGPGVTNPLRPSQQPHIGARVWEWRENPFHVPLEEFSGLFPTSVISFREEGWRRLPWRVVVLSDCTPEWSINSSARVYINSDVSESTLLDSPGPVPGASESIEVDIILSVMRQMHTLLETYEISAVEEIGRSDRRSFAALASHLSDRIGRPLAEAVRLAVESPLELIEHARATARLFTAGR